MKKLIFIFLIAVVFPFSAHPFWILSSKAKVIKSANKQVNGDPATNLVKAIKDFDEKDYKKAFITCRFIAKKYPDSVEASEAQYYMGRSLEELKTPYEAYFAYQKILDSYPNSKRINEVVEREYAIAMQFAEKEQPKLLGLKKYDFTEHPGVVIFKSLAEKVPNSEYGSKAQYQLGMLFIKLKRYDDAKEAFTRLIDKYPDSAWYAPAKYQLAQATAKGFAGTDYDARAVHEATARLDEFLSSHPDSDVAGQASDSLKDLNEKAAKKSYETASFYEQRKQYKAAKVYYEIVLDKYPRTGWAEKSDIALKRVEGKI